MLKPLPNEAVWHVDSFHQEVGTYSLIYIYWLPYIIDILRDNLDIHLLIFSSKDLLTHW